METKCGLGELLQSYAYLEYYTQNWNFFLLIPFKLNFLKLFLEVCFKVLHCLTTKNIAFSRMSLAAQSGGGQQQHDWEGNVC